MGQHLETFLKNLNPMVYWRNVIGGGGHIKPKILVIDYGGDLGELYFLVERLASNRTFVIETESQLRVESLSINSTNIVYSPADAYVGAERDKMWKQFDYLVCQKNDYEQILPALLSGVTVCYSLEELSQKLENDNHDSLARVDNYECGKALFDKLLMA